jgi:hypothetical protein
LKYDSLLVKSQEHLNNLEVMKGLSTIDGQIILASYMKRINAYESQIIDINEKQKILMNTLSSANTAFSYNSDMTYDKTGTSKTIVMIMIMMLFVVLSFLVVLLKVFIQKSLSMKNR